MQQAMLKERSRVPTLPSLCFFSAYSALKGFSLQSEQELLSPTMDLLDDSESGFFFCAAPQNSRTMGKLSSETNTEHQQFTFRHSLHREKKHLFTDYRPNYRGGNSVFFGSRQERLGLLFGTNAVVDSGELLSSPGSQRNVKGCAFSRRASSQ